MFFIGGSGNFRLTPKQYTALPNIKLQTPKMKFVLRHENGNLGPTYLYWRDVDLNTYKMKIGINRGEYFIDDPPKVKRSGLFYTMSWHWLDWLFNCIFQKEWFTDFEVPKDNALVIIN